MANSAPGESRNCTTVDNPAPGTSAPTKIDRFLDVIAYSPDGELILIGASSLTTTLWRGSAWIFKEANLSADAPLKLSPAQCQAGSSTETGVSSGIFLSNRQVLLGSDSGALHVHELKEYLGCGDPNKSWLELLGSCNEHSSAVLDLDILGAENSVVSCSQDLSIKVWDVQNLASQYTFSPAHSRFVSGVKTQPESCNTFASTSLDGTALMWDIRKSKPATCLYTSSGVGLSAVTWTGPATLVLGAVSGDLVTVDVRKLTEPSESLKLLPRPVHRLRSCPQDQSLVAVCQDTSQFSVIKCQDTNAVSRVYQDDRHEDFVRCAAWHPRKNKTAITCSWDSTVLSHCIPETMNGF